ncbi:hypothetical protein QTN25_009585 [Entamoeba marina]
MLKTKATKSFVTIFKKQCKSLANQTISFINPNIFDVFSVDENKGVCQFTKINVSIASFQSSSSAVLVFNSAVVSIVFEELDGKNGSSEALRQTIETIKNNLALCQTIHDVAKSLVNAANVAHHSLVQSTTKSRLIITASIRPLIGELYTIILSIGGGFVYQFDDENSTTVFEETTDGFIGFPKPNLKKSCLKGIHSSFSDTIFVQSLNLDIPTTDFFKNLPLLHKTLSYSDIISSLCSPLSYGCCCMFNACYAINKTRSNSTNATQFGLLNKTSHIPKLSLSPRNRTSQLLNHTQHIRNSSCCFESNNSFICSVDQPQINHLPPLYRSKPFTLSPRSSSTMTLHLSTSLQSTPRPAFTKFIQNRSDGEDF